MFASCIRVSWCICIVGSKYIPGLSGILTWSLNCFGCLPCLRAPGDRSFPHVAQLGWAQANDLGLPTWGCTTWKELHVSWVLCGTGCSKTHGPWCADSHSQKVAPVEKAINLLSHVSLNKILKKLTTHVFSAVPLKWNLVFISWEKESTFSPILISIHLISFCCDSAVCCVVPSLTILTKCFPICVLMWVIPLFVSVLFFFVGSILMEIWQTCWSS